jgi:type I restriction enzyme S subunit
MELKPGYKQTEVGVIPEDWDVESLEQFWTVIDCKHVTASFTTTGYPVASIREVQAKYVNLGNCKYTDKHFFDLLIERGRQPEDGDLIMSRNATVGEVAQVTKDHPQFAMGQDVCLLQRRDKDLSPTYLQALLQSPIIAEQLASTQVGSTFKRANVEQLRSLKVAMPPSPEQKAIADQLDCIDDHIYAISALITKKRRIKQAAMQELLTGKRRLPGFEGEWAVKRLGESLTICHGRQQHDVEALDGPYPILATGGQIGTADRPLYSKPSVLIGRKGTINKPQYMETPFWTVDTLFYSEMKSGSIAKFFYYLFCSIDWMQFNEASGVPSLNARTIENIEVSCPDLIEQTAIAAVLSEMDAELATLEARREKTRALKQAMMQELLTGRIRLR